MQDWHQRLQLIQRRIVEEPSELFALAAHQGGRCITVNAEIALLLLRMPRADFDQLTGGPKDSGVVFTVDGIGFDLLLRLVLGVRRRRLSGATFCQQLLGGKARPHTEAHMGVCVIGGPEEAQNALKARFSNGDVAAGGPRGEVTVLGGKFSPWGEPQEESFLPTYLQTDAAIDLIALGFPKGEWLGWRLERWDARRLRIQVGGGIEFAAGVVRRAPRWVQRAGLEWLYRLAAQPARLRRTVVSVGMMSLMLAALACRQRWLAPKLLSWIPLPVSPTAAAPQPAPDPIGAKAA